MLQRLGLAQALLHDPEVLILDEPTDGLDPVGRSHVRNVLTQLKHQGKTSGHFKHWVETSRCSRLGSAARLLGLPTELTTEGLSPGDRLAAAGGLDVTIRQMSST